MKDDAAVLPIEDDVLAFDEARMRNRDTFDSQKLIRDLLSTPMDEGITYGPTQNMSFKKLTQMNLDVQTRILTRMAYQAASGDVKSAEFLFKYGGLEPPKEQTLTVQTPTFIDNFMVDATIAEAEESDGDEDDEDEDDDGLPLLEAPEDDIGSEFEQPVVIEPKSYL